MIIPIKPTQMFHPAIGLVVATQVTVHVQSHVLGKSIRCNFEIQKIDQVAAAEGKPATTKTVLLANGSKDLTPEQFAARTGDDTELARCIVRNLGLELAA